MAVLAPRKEIVSGVDEDWRERVRAQLAADGRGAHARLARAIGCSPGRLTEILSSKSKYSRYVVKIHEHYGWPPPAPPIMSQDLEEIRYLIDEIGDDGRALLHELKDIDDPKRRSAVIASVRQMLSAIRKSDDE